MKKLLSFIVVLLIALPCVYSQEVEAIPDKQENEPLNSVLQPVQDPAPEADLYLPTVHKKRPILRGTFLGGLAGLVVGTIIGSIAYEEPEPNDLFGGFNSLTIAAGAFGGALGGMVVGTIGGAVRKSQLKAQYPGVYGNTESLPRSVPVSPQHGEEEIPVQVNIGVRVTF